MHRLPALLILLLAVGAGACRTVSSAAEGGSQDTGSPGISLAELLGGAFARDPVTDELPVLDRMNEPVRVTAEAVANRHVPGQVDTLKTLYYDGLNLTVYHVATGRELMQTIAVTGAQYRTGSGLRVGLARSKVNALLGPPESSTPPTSVYNLGGAMPTMLEVTFRDGAATQLEWHFPVD